MFDKLKVCAKLLLAGIFLTLPLITSSATVPPEKGIDGLRKILDGLIDGQSLPSNWCKKEVLIAKSLFSPRSYRVLGVPSEDKESQGEYGNLINVRIESSNQAGLPIVQDWFFMIAYNERATGGIGWCVRALI